MSGHIEDRQGRRVRCFVQALNGQALSGYEPAGPRRFPVSPRHGSRHGPRHGPRHGMTMTLVTTFLLAACSNHHETGPEAWWHDAAGGKIAAERPPPPGDKDPFPNLATVPARPARAEAAAMNRTTAGLVADRTNAHHEAALAGLSQPPVPIRSTPIGSTPVGSTQVQPAPPRSENKPVTAGATAPAPVSAPQPAPTPSPVAPLVAPLAPAQIAEAPLPALPEQEPPRPVVAPAPPPPLVSAAAIPPSPARVDGGIDIEFGRGSAALGTQALTEIKSTAAVRGDHGIAVTGRGETATADPSVQTAALELALARAQAIATAFVAEGVPRSVLRINTESAGRGAAIRLLP